MKNIHLIPTDESLKKRGDLVQDKFGDIHIFTIKDGEEYGKTTTKLHIYITSDEDLILGGFHFNSKYGDEPQKTDQRDIDSRKYWEEEYYYISKIILTTDPTLIADGVQSIDNEFLEWFCSQNEKVDFVEVITIQDEKD